MGFDFVREEAKGWPVEDFVPDLLGFQETRMVVRVATPFLFHNCHSM